MLLHGWTATADLNCFTLLQALGEHYRVVAFDHRGHGRGHPHRGKTFRLEDCADDVVDVADALGIDRSSPSATRWAGRSPSCSGAATPSVVDGLVLCATAPHFTGRRDERLVVPRPHRAGRARPPHARPGDARG